MLTSCSATVAISSCRNSRRASGSRLATGSSRIEQLGSFRDGQGQGELGPLAAGQLAGALVGSRPSWLDAAPGRLVVPVRVEPRAQPQVVGDAQPGVDRGLLGDEADPADLPGVVCRPLAEDLDGARRRRSSPTARLSSVVLPAPFGPTSPTTRPAGTCSVQSDSAHSTAVPLAEPGGGQGGGHATSSAVEDRNVSWNSASMLSSSRRPGGPGPASASAPGAARRGRRARRRSGS